MASHKLLAVELEKLAKGLRGEQSPYFRDGGAVAFAKEILGVSYIAPYQAEIMNNLWTKRRVAFHGPRGMGKTALLAWTIGWATGSFPSDTKIITTASVYRQLEKFLWPEVHKWFRGADFRSLGLTMRGGIELLSMGIKLPGKEAFAVATKNPSAIEGAHATHILCIIDEAKAVPGEIFDALEGVFSTGHNMFVIAGSSPGEANGRFYEIAAHRPGYEDWWTRHVTLQEVIDAGRIDPTWVEQRRLQWGEDDPRFQNQALGLFADSAIDALIPLSWVERAMRAWYETKPPDAPLVLGVDVARYGDDKTAIAFRRANYIEKIELYSKQDLMETVGHISLACGGDIDTVICVDEIGVGAGVVDRLIEAGYHNTIGINVGSRADDDPDGTRYVNLRSKLLWNLRRLLSPENDNPLVLPDSDKLTSDLTIPRWQPTSSGQIKVESKQEIKKRLGASPDEGDAVMLAFANELPSSVGYMEMW